MKDPESTSPINQNQPNWMTVGDKEFLDGLDKTINDISEIEEDLERVIVETPRLENPIKILANLRIAYDMCAKENKEAFVEMIIEKANDPETPDLHKGAMFKFLSDIDRFGTSNDDDSDLLTA